MKTEKRSSLIKHLQSKTQWTNAELLSRVAAVPELRIRDRQHLHQYLDGKIMVRDWQLPYWRLAFGLAPGRFWAEVRRHLESI